MLHAPCLAVYAVVRKTLAKLGENWQRIATLNYRVNKFLFGKRVRSNKTLAHPVGIESSRETTHRRLVRHPTESVPESQCSERRPDSYRDLATVFSKEEMFRIKNRLEFLAPPFVSSPKLRAKGGKEIHIGQKNILRNESPNHSNVD